MVEPSQFVDAESYQGGKHDDLNFRFIVLQHVNRIVQLASKEWHGGYWEDRPVGAATIRIYHEASHEAYSNAVDALADLLCPYFDDEMKNAENKHYDVDMEEANKESMDEDGKFQYALFKYRKVRMKRRLFRELSKFLHRKGYLEMGTYEEGTE